MEESSLDIGILEMSNGIDTSNIKIRGDLVSSMIAKLCHESPTSERCIFRVPKKLRHRKDDNVFDPIIVSVGPFHHVHQGVRFAEMKQIKWWYLNCLLHRCHKSPEETLELFVENITALLKDAKEHYAGSINFNDTKFIEMMVVDGCFLIELFRKSALSPQPKDDPIFSSQWILERLHHDLILLENQIPWLVLQKLYDLSPDHEQDRSHRNTALPQLVLRFFNSMMLRMGPAQYTEGQKIKHILDLLHSCLLSQSEALLPRPMADDQKVLSVTDLLLAGVKFKAGASDGIFNIKFSNGELKIPPIIIRSNSEALFRNLIAYEQCNPHGTNQFTSYALFLDCLINTVKDVDVLYHKEIFQRPGLSVEDISLLFNKLYNDTLVHGCYYGDVSLEINKRYRSRCRRWIATLKREYFKNPWRISSLIAAILILIFTGTQTVIAMLAYYNVPHF